MDEALMKEKLSTVCRQFRLPGELLFYRWIPKGHINMSYYVALFNGVEVKQYVAQKINTYVFHDPAGLMRNIELVTQHILGKVNPVERRDRLHCHHTAEGKSYLVLKGGAVADLADVSLDDDDVEVWRVYNYIEDSVSFESAEGDEKVLRLSGKAFGRFIRLLQNLDAGKLTETIPHFHDTRKRLEDFFDAVEKNVCGRAKEAEAEIELIRRYREFGESLCRQTDRGELPVRVTHNDTKTNNVLFDKKSLEPLVVIDLDTCMPGLVCYDFGDTIRFAACTAVEDEANGKQMKLDLALFRACAEGFLGELSDVLTEAETESLPVGVAVITLELAARFLTDYLTADKYFRIDDPGHNLRRTQAQLALFQDMMLHMEDMQSIIRDVAAAEKERVRIYVI